MKKSIIIQSLLAMSVLACSKSGVSSEEKMGQLIDGKVKIVGLSDRISKYISEHKKEIKTKDEIIIVQWDEWGHKSAGCDGWGLCNAVWFPESTESNNQVFQERITKLSTDIKRNNTTKPDAPQISQYAQRVTYGGLIETNKETGQKYFDILLSELPQPSLNPSDLMFHIDEDIMLLSNLKDVLGSNHIIRSGNYTCNPNLGQCGGYRIYVDKL